MKPILLSLGQIELYSYPLFIGIAWGVSYHLSRSFIEKYSDLSSKTFLRLFLLVFLFGWLGAKLFFLAFSVPDQIQEYGTTTSFWFGGGFVFYGGFLGALVYLLIELLFIKSISLKELGLFTPAVAISHAIGRVGCFLTGCCYGTHCELPWSVYMHRANRHPVQLYETIGLLTLGFLLIYLVKKNINKANLCFAYLGGYAGLRFILEFYRGDKIRGIHALGLSTSQIVSLAIMLGSILVFAYRFFRGRRS